MNTNSIPRPDAARRSVDSRGWLVLGWVVVWSAAYLHYALATRFPWMKAWLAWFS